ncbi:hypothetical protein [Parafrankia discariae]|uniref:hypothetical protein n=1 Tax=Parafrankia discariae TaxID=365528 RepID=UPI000371C022|nr:hypothetical protein [Parafrankia discariae]
MALLLDTSALAPDERVEAFYGALSSVHMPARVKVVTEQRGIHCRLEGHQLGPALDVLEMHSSGHRIARTARELKVIAPERI